MSSKINRLSYFSLTYEEGHGTFEIYGTVLLTHKKKQNKKFDSRLFHDSKIICHITLKSICIMQQNQVHAI